MIFARKDKLRLYENRLMYVENQRKRTDKTCDGRDKKTALYISTDF